MFSEALLLAAVLSPGRAEALEALVGAMDLEDEEAVKDITYRLRRAAAMTKRPGGE
jgi:hypothetical protein